MGFEQVEEAVALLDERQQAELISYTLQLRHAQDAEFHNEVATHHNDTDKSHWLTPDEFERRLEGE